MVLINETGFEWDLNRGLSEAYHVSLICGILRETGFELHLGSGYFLEQGTGCMLLGRGYGILRQSRGKSKGEKLEKTSMSTSITPLLQLCLWWGHDFLKANSRIRSRNLLSAKRELINCLG